MSFSAPAVPCADERRRVAIALEPARMAAYLGAALGAAPQAGTRRLRPACRILDVRYEWGEGVSILYEFERRLVRGHCRWAGEEDVATPEPTLLIEPLGMRVCYFEQDPALPGLAAAIDPNGAAAVLARELPECRSGEARLLRCRPRLLRYRPGRRCTLRYELWLRETRGGRLRQRILYGKVYHDLAKAASVYDEMTMLADSKAARAGGFVAAHVVAFLRDLRLILQEPVEGTPLELVLGGLRDPATAGDRRGWDGVVRSAAAFAALHAASLSTRRERPIDRELAKLVKRAGLAAQLDARSGARLHELAAALPAWLPRLAQWEERTTLVHGDAKPGQCLVAARGIALLDFDHCGMADPATDVGSYLASLRQRALAQGPPIPGAAREARLGWLRALAVAFVDEYCRVSGVGEAFRRRASFYEAVALMRKALRSFARSPRSPLPLAQVDEAWRVLAALPSPA